MRSVQLSRNEKVSTQSNKTQSKVTESKQLVKGLHADKELVFHIEMTPAKLPDLLINNGGIALVLLICMTNTTEITKYPQISTKI